MGIDTEITSGDSAATPDASEICAFLAVSQNGAGSVYRFVPGDDVQATLGDGPGTEDVLSHLRNSGVECLYSGAAKVDGSLSSVTHSGSGPSVTASGTPLNWLNIKARVAKAGGLAAAVIDVALDGASYSYSYIIPDESPAVLVGTVDITNGADIEGKTLVFTAPSSLTLTFAAGSLAASSAALKAATATSASPVTLTATDLLTGGLAIISAHPRRLKFTTAGSMASDAPANVVITGKLAGSVVSETLNLSQTAGSVTSVNDYDEITSLAYAAGDGTGATIAIGYSSAFANASEIVDAANALIVAGAGSAIIVAEVKQDSSGHAYLRLYTASKGAGVSLTIDTATSTADTVLGYAGSGATATGAAATLALPHTGVALTFPSGTYPAGDTYSLSATGPLASVSAYMTAADNLRAWCQTNNRGFGFVACAQPWDTATNARAFTDALDAKLTTWNSNTAAPVFAYSIAGTVLHTASATSSTNAANIAVNDNAVNAAFNTPGNVHVSVNTVAHGDCYMTGSQVLGKFRKTAVIPLAARRAKKKISDDPGDGAAGGLPECSLVHPDGVTEARDETRSTNQVKMSGSSGPGFTTLGTKKGTPRVMRGVTRAGQSSRFVDMGVIAPTLRAATVLHAAAESLENGTYLPAASGKLTDGEREALNSALTSDLRANVFEEPNSYFGFASAQLDAAEVIANSRRLTIAATLQALGQGENISLKISTVGIVSLTSGS